jgi:hypothetical protein
MRGTGNVVHIGPLPRHYGPSEGCDVGVAAVNCPSGGSEAWRGLVGTSVEDVLARVAAVL